MSIYVKEVETKSEWKEFVFLPEKIHKNHSNWLHPLYMDDKKFFDKDRNPSYKNNKAKLFLAYNDQQVVGRIMGIIPTKYNEGKEIKCARFSYMECYEDKEVFDALLKAVTDWALGLDCQELIGPMGFSDKEPQGFVTKGFDEPTMFVTNCTYPYMKEFIEENQFNSFVKLHEYEVPIDDQIKTRYEKFIERVARNHQVKLLEFKKGKQVKPYVSGVFALINKTYKEIYGFTEVTEAERDEFANRFLPLLNPKLIKIIVDQHDKVVAFVIAMPDLSEGIRKARGRVYPVGWIHLLKSFRTSKRLVLLLGGVDPAMQNKGLDAILAESLFKSAIELGFKTMDSHLIMKDNKKMIAEIERLEGHRLCKEYTIYKKTIG